MEYFHSHEQEIHSIHEITNNDWEAQIDQIYIQIISLHFSALCLATNTLKTDEDDKVGGISKEIVFKFNKDLDASAAVGHPPGLGSYLTRSNGFHIIQSKISFRF